MIPHSIFRLITVFLLLFCLNTVARAQTAYITGPSPVDVGDTVSYTVNYSGSISWVIWDFGTNAVVISSSSSSNTETKTIKWTSAGSKYVDAAVSGSKGNIIVGLSVTVNAPCTSPTAGSISGGNTTICSGDGRTLTLSGSSGGDGNYTYQWESKPDGYGSFSDIIGETSNTFTISSGWSTDTEYRVKVSSCSLSSYTSSAYVNYTQTVGGTVTASSSQICGTEDVIFEIGGSVGTILRWMSRYKDGEGAYTSWATFEETDDIDSLEYQLEAWSEGVRTYQIKAVVKEGSCDAAHPSVLVEVDSEPTAGTIIPSDTVLCASGQVDFSLTGHEGTVQEWVYRYKDGANAWNAFQVFQPNDTVNASLTLSPSGTSENRNYEIQAVIGNDICANDTASIDVLVYGDITPVGFTAGYDLTFVSDLGEMALANTGESPTGGTWSGTYVSEGNFDTSGATPGTYILSYTYIDSISGCQVTVTKDVEILESLAVESSLGGDIYLSTTSTLSVPDMTNHTYQWSLNASPISGATSHSILATLPGSYDVNITAPNSQQINIQFELNAAFASTSGNYIREHTYRQPVQDKEDAWGLEMIAEQITYYDGIGRLAQTISTAGSANYNDIVTISAYDDYGRRAREYLPYTLSNPTPGLRDATSISNQEAFWSNTMGYTDTVTWAEKDLELSSVNRILRQASPGNNWGLDSDHTVSMQYGLNKSNQVRKWEVDTADILTFQGFYEANELLRTTTIDEDGNTSIEYKNKQNQTILKCNLLDTVRAETYYVYDDRWNLRVVLPPMASDTLESVGVTVSILKEYAFTYGYDGRGRLISQQTPGVDTVLMVYDKWDRLVLSQDGNQRRDNIWSYNKYDRLNRPIISGLIQYYEGLVDDVQGQEVRYEGLTEEPFVVASLSDRVPIYSDDAFPHHNGSEILSVTYYDNYDFLNYPGEWPQPAFDYFNEGLESDAGITYQMPDSVRSTSLGNFTGELVRNLGEDTFQKNTYYYDLKGRLIQLVSSDQAGGYTRNSYLYSFEDLIIARKASRYDSMTAVEPGFATIREFKYDHRGRLLESYHEIEADLKHRIASYSYDELGRMKERNLHPGVPSMMQSIDYSYNIRDWLVSINDPDEPTSENDHFGMKFFYDADPGFAGHQKKYNGSISAVKWKNGSEQVLGYTYSYDDLDRITQASHFMDGVGASIFSLPKVAYDLNGNIKSIERTGASASLIDSLVYSYNGNKLRSVDDFAEAEGYNDGHASTEQEDDYHFDPNGNVVVDSNKAIDSIYYNYLNLPYKIAFATGDSIVYTYTADATKTGQLVYKNGEVTSRQSYIGGFVFEDDELKFIQHEEGIVEWDTLKTRFDYQYQIRDHLGNTRVTFSAMPNVFQDWVTMEDERSAYEDEYFENISDTRVTMALANHTPNDSIPGANKAARVPNTDPIGPMGMIKVNKGDTLQISAWAYYEGDATANSQISESLIFSALISSMDASAVGFSEGSSVFESELDDALDFPNNLSPKNSANDDAPKAFLNYFYYDRDMSFISSGFVQVSQSALLTLELLQIQLDPTVLTSDGYVMYYVSNESTAVPYVHFDDIMIRHVRTNILLTEDYYPMGLTFNGWDRDNADFTGTVTNPGLGWKDLGFRNYEASLGKFHSVDPLAEFQFDQSPYQYASNNPVRNIDALGLLPYDGNQKKVGKDKKSRKKKKGKSSSATMKKIKDGKIKALLKKLFNRQPQPSSGSNNSSGGNSQNKKNDNEDSQKNGDNDKNSGAVGEIPVPLSAVAASVRKRNGSEDNPNDPTTDSGGGSSGRAPTTRDPGSSFQGGNNDGSNPDGLHSWIDDVWDEVKKEKVPEKRRSQLVSKLVPQKALALLKLDASLNRPGTHLGIQIQTQGAAQATTENETDSAVDNIADNKISTEEAIEILNNAVSELDAVFDQEWTESQHGTPNAHEEGLAIGKDDQGNLVPYNFTNTTISTAVNIHLTPYPAGVVTAVGVYHTHADDDGLSGIGPSPEDINKMRFLTVIDGKFQSGGFSIIEAGDVRIGLVVTDVGKVKDFFAQPEAYEEKLHDAFYDIQKPLIQNGMSYLDANLVALFNILPEGIEVFITDDPEKQNFVPLEI